MRSKGALIPDGDHATLTFRRTQHHAIERVWAAISTIFRYELTADGDATHLLVTYRRITLQTAWGFLPGLHVLLDRLEAQLDGNALPAFAPAFDALRTEYPAWSHAPAAGQ